MPRKWSGVVLHTLLVTQPPPPPTTPPLKKASRPSFTGRPRWAESGGLVKNNSLTVYFSSGDCAETGIRRATYPASISTTFPADRPAAKRSKLSVSHGRLCSLSVYTRAGPLSSAILGPAFFSFSLFVCIH